MLLTSYILKLFVIVVTMFMKRSLGQTLDSVFIFTQDRNNNRYEIYSNGQLNQIWNITETNSHSSCQTVPIAIENTTIDSRIFGIQNLGSSNIEISNIIIETNLEVLNLTMIGNRTSKIASNATELFEIQYDCHNENIIKQNLNGWSYIQIKISTSTESINFGYMKICTLENRSRVDLSLFLILSLAIFVVASATRIKKGFHQEDSGSQRDEIKPVHAFYFVAFASLSLAVFYFLRQYIQSYFTIVFSLSTVSCLTILFSDWLEDLCLKISGKCHNTYSLKFFGDFKMYHIPSFLLAAILVVFWYITRHWILNNLIGVGIVCLLFKLVKLPSLKTAFILLGACFCYDIFWVFISKLIFGESVMVATASAWDIPIKLEWPYFIETPMKSCSVLGLGDIILPGFFVTLNYRFGYYKRTILYYYSSLLAYVLAIFSCGLVLFFTGTGQPALLYIVPMMLFVTTYISYKRGELKEFWEGVPDTFEYENMINLANCSDIVRLQISTEDSAI